jgi:hypothetical protein
MDNFKINYRVYRRPPLAPVMSQMNPFHSLRSSFDIHFNIILPFKPKPIKWSLFFAFQHKIHVGVFLLLRRDRRSPPFDHFSSDHPINTLTYYAIFSSLLLLPPSQNPIFLSAAIFLFVWETKFHTHTKDRRNCALCRLFQSFCF